MRGLSSGLHRRVTRGDGGGSTFAPMRRLLLPLLAALLAASLTAGLATADSDRDDPRRPHGAAYAIGLWGDLPYSEEQRATGVPNLIEDMNRQRLAFTIHDGDIKAGGERCDDAVYPGFRDLLDRLRSPAFYTPGDNEWTDCDRPAAGGFASGERLDLLRRTLFPDDRTRGRRAVRVEQQAAPYVENRRWEAGGVSYATLHVVGSDNNRSGDVSPDPAEYAARNAATNAWLRGTFARARERRSAAVFLTIQANPGFDAADPTRAPVRDPRTLEPRDGFFDFLVALREEAAAFRRPVVLLHGDSHYFRIDKPLLDAQGRRLENFTRVETPGDNAQAGNNDVGWLKVLVEPRSREVFALQPQIVPANRVAVPAP